MVRTTPSRTTTLRRGVSPALAGVAAAGLLIVGIAVVLLLLPGPGKKKDRPAASGHSDRPKPLELPDAAAETPPAYGQLRVDTPLPGFLVFVDGEPARTAAGELLKTPCRLRLPQGGRRITVARRGFATASELVQVGESSEFAFGTIPEEADAPAVEDSPLFEAPAGKPIPLESLAVCRPADDPFLTPDQLQILFAGRGPEGAGVYLATRGLVVEPFGAPVLLPRTRSSADRAASPSVTSDGMLLAYAVPEKARVWGLVRRDPLAPFDDDKELLAASDAAGEVWRTAQLSGDGLRLYVGSEFNGETRLLVFSRSRRDKPFGTPLPMPLESAEPEASVLLSARIVPDERTAYFFETATQNDGAHLALRKASRASRNAPFGRAAPVMTVGPLGQAVPVGTETGVRGWVAPGEEWLYFAAGPEESSRLFALRLHDTASSVRAPRGEPAAPLETVAATDAPAGTEPPQETVPAPTPMETDVGGTSDLLPYARFRRDFLTLVEKRDYAGARRLAASAVEQPELAAERSWLEADRDDAAGLEEFWILVEEAVRKLAAGDECRVAGQTVQFVRLDQGVLHARSRTRDVARSVRELATGDLVFLVDRGLGAEDTQAHLRVARFLYYDSQGKSGAFAARLARAGDAGWKFFDALLGRRVHLARQDLERGRLLEALAQLDAVESEAARVVDRRPASQAPLAARESARTLRQEVYAYVKWERRGPRTWQNPAAGEYEAAPGRQAGSLLVSARTYSHFDLTLEWKTEGALGQGGVYFRYRGTGPPLNNAVKLQLSNDAGVRPDNFCTGALFNRRAPASNAAKPAGEWNTLKLSVRGEQIVAEINGVVVQKSSLTVENLPLEGYVALDGDLGGITYRNVLLVERSAAP